MLVREGPCFALWQSRQPRPDFQQHQHWHLSQSTPPPNPTSSRLYILLRILWYCIATFRDRQHCLLLKRPCHLEHFFHH